MTRTAAAILLLCLPSVLTAKPTIALFLDDSEGEMSIRPPQTIASAAEQNYWWFGKLELLWTICRGVLPPYSIGWDQAGSWAPSPLLLNTTDLNTWRGPETLPRQNVSGPVVLDLVDQRPFDTHIPWVETTASEDRNAARPFAWAWSGPIRH